ncbi:serine/threonine-protein kinase Chk1-like [Oratosquilla oratoria]|uniref:serine/threonine-protein kinase Chk1-like n=1 Tax=Oratosquilla oratoria TaxID=337810 RepID=UPI003F7596EF
MAFFNLCWKRLQRWISRREEKGYDNEESRRGSSEEAIDETEVFKNLVTRVPKKKILQENTKKAETFLYSSDWCKLKLLGRGSFGKVVLMKNETSEELVAQKSVPRFFQSTALREEYVHCQIQHRNVVQLICFQRTLKKVVLCLEYCAGGFLSNVIGHINEEETHKLFDQLMEAVEYLHSRGVVHRDLKPRNLLLTEEKILKVADFGLAAMYVVKNEEVLFKECVGTRAYTAPEVLESSKYAGPPVDLWSCGVTLFTMINGEKPWESPDFDNRFYKLWVNEDEGLNDFRVWNRLSVSSQEILRAFLAVDPFQRVLRWHTLRALRTG